MKRATACARPRTARRETLSSKARRIRLLFRVGIVAKGVDGLLEIIGGLMLLVVSPAFVRGAVALPTAHELSEDPDDWLAHSVRHLVSSFQPTPSASRPATSSGTARSSWCWSRACGAGSAGPIRPPLGS
jgi:hypothetical protein